MCWRDDELMGRYCIKCGAYYYGTPEHRGCQGFLATPENNREEEVEGVDSDTAEQDDKPPF